MENPADGNSYEEIKRKAREFYGKIGLVWCTALNDHIVFNSVGFRHLIWKGAEQRPQQEQKRRFALLPYIKNTLTNHRGMMEFREEIRTSIVKEHGKKIRRLSRARFWGLVINGGDGTTITIVIRQIDSRNKHFFSIY